MTQYGHLWLFATLVLGVVVLPGLDMAYIMGSALSGGRRAGFAALAGVVAGGVCHVVMTGLGVSVLLRTVPGAFNALLVAGALYIAWIGVSLIRSHAAFSVAATVDRPLAATFRQGMLTCLLNPKAYLFMLAIFPQFLRPEYGALVVQAAVMWLIIALNQVFVYGGLALAADRARRWLSREPAAGVFVARSVGVLLIGAAMFTGIEGWRG
ncbi:MAG TPA: LysE family translocator [Luteimonas sp.]|nr:LysE family translocator [Luteimonas sp.]